jgi:hypothetical protein
MVRSMPRTELFTIRLIVVSDSTVRTDRDRYRDPLRNRGPLDRGCNSWNAPCSGCSADISQ